MARKLTREEKDRLLNAAELIATGRSRFSCDAVLNSGSFSLLSKYESFYEKIDVCFWGVDSDVWPHEARNRRILMILLFREVGLVFPNPRDPFAGRAGDIGYVAYKFR